MTMPQSTGAGGKIEVCLLTCHCCFSVMPEADGSFSHWCVLTHIKPESWHQLSDNAIAVLPLLPPPLPAQGYINGGSS